MNTYTFNTSTLARNLIGFDPFFDKLLNNVEEAKPFPPYNIRKVGETSYNIEIAVAGFARDEIDITYQENILTITGTKKNKPAESEFIYKGIAERDFTRRFTLAQDVEIGFADIYDGILMIALKRIIPEEKKPKKIPLGGSWDSKPELLKG